MEAFRSEQLDLNNIFLRGRKAQHLYTMSPIRTVKGGKYMGIQNPIKQSLTVAVILIFIGLAFAPSINASVVKDAIKERVNEYEKIFELDNPKEMQHRLINSYSNILTNETFIQIMRSPEIQSVLTSEATAQFYKSTAAQKILHSQEFKDLCNSEVFQKFQTSLSLSSDTPTIGQILLFIITWIIVGIVLWIPAVIILFTIALPIGTIWSSIFFVTHNLSEFVIFAPIIWLIVCTLLTIIWPIFAIWFVYCVLTWYGLFPEIWG